jgi:hypothetical protein
VTAARRAALGLLACLVALALGAGAVFAVYHLAFASDEPVGSNAAGPGQGRNPEPAPTQEPTQMPTPDPAPDPTPSPTPGTTNPSEPAIRSAHWVERSDGPSLFVDPAEWVRLGGQAEWEQAMDELAALHPEAASESMRNQFICHAVGAPDKETWNLEPWREDIGLLGFALAACNP